MKNLQSRQQTESHVQKIHEDSRVLWSLYIFLAMTIFMAFTNNFDGNYNWNSSETIFNKIEINKKVRSDIYFLLNELILLPLLIRRKGLIFRLAFWVFIQKFIYNLGLLLQFYEYNKGYSDYLSLGVMIAFMIYDKIKWKFRSDIFT